MRICQTKKWWKKLIIELMVNYTCNWSVIRLIDSSPKSKKTNTYFSFQSRIDAEINDLNELQIYLKKENTTQFYCNINTKAIAWDQIKKEKKMKQIFANAVKKKSKKKWHTTKHTLSFYCEKKAWLCAVYTLIMIFLIIECAILKCNPKYSPLGKKVLSKKLADSAKYV